MIRPKHSAALAAMLFACVVVPSCAKFGDKEGGRTMLHDDALVDSAGHVKTQSLVTTIRFDLMPKLIYAESFLSGTVSTWARYVYVEHERAFNGLIERCYGRGLHKGWGCKPKNGEAQFTAAFDKLIRSIRADGFRSPPHEPIHVMASSGGRMCPVNGAHRVMASYALDKAGAIPTTLIKKGNKNKVIVTRYPLDLDKVKDDEVEEDEEDSSSD